MPRFLTLVVGVAAVVIGGAAQVRRAGDRPFIAFRYDAERVVIYVADEARLPPPDPGQPRSLPPGALAPAAPGRRALLRGGATLDLDTEWYRLTRDGDPRLYVRTRPLVDGRPPSRCVSGSATRGAT
jgi:hypothetical protein